MWSRWPSTGLQGTSTLWMMWTTVYSCAVKMVPPVSSCWTWNFITRKELHWTLQWGEMSRTLFKPLSPKTVCRLWGGSFLNSINLATFRCLQTYGFYICWHCTHGFFTRRISSCRFLSFFIYHDTISILTSLTAILHYKIDFAIKLYIIYI